MSAAGSWSAGTSGSGSAPSCGAVHARAGYGLPFIVLAFAGLATIGLAITGGGPIPVPVGWGTEVLSALVILGLTISGDMPPFTVYLPTLVIGIALLTGG